MTDHKLEDVEARLSQLPIYKDTELKVDFILKDESGRVDLSNDSVSFVGKNLTSGNKVFDVSASHTNASQGETQATVDASKIDESGVFLFELQWDDGDNGTVTDRMQWKQEVKETAG